MVIKCWKLSWATLNQLCMYVFSKRLQRFKNCRLYYFLSRYTDIFRSYLCSMKKAGVIPIVVFDRFPLPAKASETERRWRWEHFQSYHIIIFIVMFTFCFWLKLSCDLYNYLLFVTYLFVIWYREKEDRLKKAEEPNILEEEANKLRSQAVEICFTDITECINVRLTFPQNTIVIIRNKQSLHHLCLWSFSTIDGNIWIISSG